MIAVVDYGVGNLYSLSSSLAYLGFESLITRDTDALASASHILLPGVGAFGDAMQKLEATGVIPALRAHAAAGKPLMGICLGMQLLFEESHEYGLHRGLGLLQGSVCPLEPDLRAAGYAHKVPHMGWNALRLTGAGGAQAAALLQNTQAGDAVYFVHSYYVKGCEASLAAVAEYGVDVPAVVARGSVYGCQFHPEKSGVAGLGILRAFAAIV